MSHTNSRKIIHIDADAFYASVEMRENPELINKAVAVGGQPNSRGVIATCNYAARQFGVRSAMPSSHAQRLCPNLVFVRPNFPLYKQVSQQIREIMLRYTEIIEPLSLDEAYLDVSNTQHFEGSATRIAQAIKFSVKQELNLIVSAGVAPNKFLAKIASDWQKPDGLFVIKPEAVGDFVRELPVGKINGVGKVTTKKLEELGINTCGDLQTMSLEQLSERFGKYGARLYDYARGIDNRAVHTSRERKSLSVEHTYSSDISNMEDLHAKAHSLYEDLLDRAKKLPADTLISKRFVKVKFADFNQTTLEEKLPASDKVWQNREEFIRLMQCARARSNKAVRLMGMGIRLQSEKNTDRFAQLSLF